VDYEGSRFLNAMYDAQHGLKNNNVQQKQNKGQIEHECNDSNYGDDNTCQPQECWSQSQTSKQDLTNEEVIKKCRYLFLYTEKDEQLEIQMRYERERERMMAQIYKVKTKDIDIDYLLTKDPRNMINVTRLP
jgi:hypothetical protein